MIRDHHPHTIASSEALRELNEATPPITRETLAELLGVPGAVRGLASVEYCDDAHGSYVGIEHDDGVDVVLAAALRYAPHAHHPDHRHAFQEELLAVLARAGYRPVGPVTWGADHANVRVEVNR